MNPAKKSVRSVGSLMLRIFGSTLTLMAVVLTSVAQEAGYGEDRIARSRVPQTLMTTAAKEAPGVQFQFIYRDNEKGHRFVGKAADGRTYSVRLDQAGAVEFRHIFTDVATDKLPPPVAATVRDEVARNKALAGFRSARTSLVERFNARKNETEKYYEVFGRTADRLHPRIEVETSGKLVRVDTSFIPSTSDYIKRESLNQKDVPPKIRQGITEALPGIQLGRVYRVTNRGSTDVGYEAYGKVKGGRGAELVLGSNGRAVTIAVSLPMTEVPRSAFEAITRASRTEKDLVGFRPTEARQLRLVALSDECYQFFGDGPDGQPLDVRVDARGGVTVQSDSGEVAREEAGILPPRAREENAVAASGFSVLAARYGVDHYWIDVTDDLRRLPERGSRISM